MSLGLVPPEGSGLGLQMAPFMAPSHGLAPPCVSPAILCVSEIPFLIKTSVKLDESPPQQPHFDLISIGKTLSATNRVHILSGWGLGIYHVNLREHNSDTLEIRAHFKGHQEGPWSQWVVGMGSAPCLRSPSFVQAVSGWGVGRGHLGSSCTVHSYRSCVPLGPAQMASASTQLCWSHLHHSWSYRDKDSPAL